MTSAFENVNRHFKEFLLLLSKSIQLPRASGKGVKYPIITIFTIQIMSLFFRISLN